MYCYGVPLKCVLYKKRYEVCYRCGQLGHRSDVRIIDHVRCRGCGMTAPPKDHACEPKCKLCGKGHMTDDRKCKEAFRTPYTIKKRQWEAWRRMEGEERKAKDADPQTCRMGEIKERSREPVEASERVKRKSRFLSKTTGKTRRRAATNYWSSKRGDFRQCCPQQWETHVAEPQESWEALLCSPDPNVQRDIISQALAAAASQGIPADN
ncbi:hypothetical protein HPB51_022809 [Rhipicephalus microplus]|uniref:Uncharacterized protein n=1 Tax=Rhipicephalus microplus TaxID=6941 RepID=A0A9J6ED76_RHIMP|nr:hypothetical protein HPB51_022809 [Rhipicephalus microplus]